MKKEQFAIKNDKFGFTGGLNMILKGAAATGLNFELKNLSLQSGRENPSFELFTLSSTG